MGYPIKTSSDDWLSKAIELYYNRVSIDIIDDGNFGLNKDSEILKVFSRHTLSTSQILWTSIFYVLALICGYLFVISFSVKYAKEIALILAGLGVVFCLALPTVFLRRHKPPIITEKGEKIKITFR